MKKLDPRSRIVVVAVLSTLSLIFTQPQHLLLIFLTMLLTLIGLEISLILIFKRLKKLFYFLSLLLVIQALFYSGETYLLEFNSVKILSLEGFFFGIGVIIRLLIILCSALIIADLKPSNLIQGFTRLGLPYELSYMIALGLRFLPQIRDEAQDVLRAIQLRGIDLKALSLRGKITIYSYIFFPLISISILRAREIAVAMESRAFRSHPQRSFLHPLKLETVDYLIITGSLIIFIVLVLLKIKGGF